MTDLTHDHVGLSDTFASRRYFRKFERITGHLARVAGRMQAEGQLSKEEVNVLTRYLVSISYTFRALSMKYLFVGRNSERGTGRYMFRSLEFDAVESGFPVISELRTMANDALQAENHLKGLPSETALKDQMVRKIIGDREIPSKLQYALSQRLYYQELQKGNLFWAQNHPEAVWLSGVDPGRRTYLLHWATYDSQTNLPVIYLMEVEDSGNTALARDQNRWPEVQTHLMGQAMGGLKLITIAKAFDLDFDDLHPKRLRRFHVGPMYSSAFTRQNGPLHDVLTQANSPVGDDWALAWTMEELESKKVKTEKSGWFGTVEREIFALDPFSGRGVDTGATRTERAIILPQRPYQVLEELSPKGFSSVRKFVVSPQGKVLSY